MTRFIGVAALAAFFAGAFLVGPAQADDGVPCPPPKAAASGKPNC